MSSKKHPILLAGLTIATTLASLHVANRIMYHLSLKNISKPVEEFYDWRYGKIHYKKTGEGAPILLLHTLESGSSMHEWDPLIDQISKTNTVYAIDLLGCGHSDKPACTYTNYLYVSLVADFINHVIKEPCKVVASGLSCTFTLLCNQLYPDLFSGMMFVQPPTMQDTKQYPTTAKKIKKFIYELPIIGTFLYNLAFLPDTLEKIAAKQFCSKTAANNWVMDQQTYSHVPNHTARYLYASLAADYCMMDCTPALRKLSKPLTVVLGTHGEQTQTIIEEYLRINPGIDLMTIERTKEYPHIDRPVRFYNVALKNFLLK